MTEQAQDVLIANARFYQALSLADGLLMQRVWFRSPDTTCVHPGWNKVTGYENIQQSWSAIFLNQGPVHIWPSDESVIFESGIAWVACIENVDASATTTGAIIMVRARNAFCKVASGWKLMHHYAEPIAGQEIQPINQRLALN
jgi:hypothetical protein